MPDHKKEITIHLLLLANTTQKLSAENQLQQLVKENQELRHKQQITENELGTLKLKVQLLVSQFEFPIGYHVKQTDEEVYLPALYTHPPNGY